MRIVYFTHSLASCWNHGNAHFLRGVLRALDPPAAMRSQASSPPAPGACATWWPTTAEAALDAFRDAIPTSPHEPTDPTSTSPRRRTDADLVIVHEWNDPRARRRPRRRPGARRPLHPAVPRHPPPGGQRPGGDRAPSTSPATTACWRSARLWRRSTAAGAGARRAFVWHEAADITPLPSAGDEASRATGWSGSATGATASARAELERFLLAPGRARPACRSTSMACAIPPRRWRCWRGTARATAAGWPTPRAPAVFARHLATVHVPRRFYVEALPGIPTIRVFEALACGIPLVCAPWSDAEAPVPAGRGLSAGARRRGDDRGI